LPQIHAHYFEDGNVQLQSTKAIPQKTVPFTEVLDAIKKAENDLQAGLEDMYQNMNEETLRDMRRVMTVSRTKMEWNVNAQRMVRTLRK
jgi:capping protein alpha